MGKTQKTRNGIRKIRGEERRVQITRLKNGKEKIKLLKRRKSGPKKKRRFISYTKAKEIHRNRSKKSQQLDERKKAKTLVYDTRWEKNPGKYDYIGVDTQKKRTKGFRAPKRKKQRQTVLGGKR